MITIPDRGHKHICSGCATRFFDMNKKSAACPKCNQPVPEIKATVVIRKRRSRI